MYRRILVPLDGSARAEVALQHAEHLAQRFQSEIILLRVVVSPYAVVAPDLVLARSDPALQELSVHVERYLAEMAAGVRAKGIEVGTISCEGPVAEAILDHIAALDVQLVIMSTHGRGGVSRWVYGSVAERVLQGTRCPLLLVRSVES